MVDLERNPRMVAQPAELTSPGSDEHHGFPVYHEVDREDHRNAIDDVPDAAEVELASQQFDAFGTAEVVQSAFPLIAHLGPSLVRVADADQRSNIENSRRCVLSAQGSKVPT